MSIDLFDGLSRAELMAELGLRMSSISERATCERWHYTAGEDIPRACYEISASGRSEYFDSISVATARLLIALADRLGHWVIPNKGQVGWKRRVPKAMKERASRTEQGAKKPPTTG